MTKFKKALLVVIAVIALSAITVTAYAASNYGSPAEAVAALTGKTVEEVRQERTENGKSYGAMALEAGKLKEFLAEKLEIRKERLAEKVADGKITQEKADEIIAAVEERQANCDGTGSGQLQQRLGGQAGGNRRGGQGTCEGQGSGNRQGGKGAGNGTCSGGCQNP